MRDFRAQAEALRDEMIVRRRDFHQHPEIAFEEVRSAGIVAQELHALGLEVQTGVGKTGVVGILEGSEEGPTVLVRCDMDALPINEENEIEYRSLIPNRMHACGHDGHMTVALAVAKILSQQRDTIHGRVKFIFQPAEEAGQGAQAMLRDGVLNDPTPDVAFGIHLWNELPIGEVAITSGAMMAGADIFSVRLKGNGAHAALPHRSTDTIMALVQCVAALQTIASRNVPPLETAVVSVTQVHGGEARNVLPAYAEFHGTIRTFSDEVRDRVVKRFNAIVNGTAQALGCTADITIDRLSLPVINNDDIAARLHQTLSQAAPQLTYRSDYRTMAAEDVADFLERVPGVYFFVGSANAERHLNYAHHHPRFDFDEEALVIGSSLLTAAVADYVLP